MRNSMFRNSSELLLNFPYGEIYIYAGSLVKLERRRKTQRKRETRATNKRQENAYMEFLEKNETNGETSQKH